MKSSYCSVLSDCLIIVAHSIARRGGAVLPLTSFFFGCIFEMSLCSSLLASLSAIPRVKPLIPWDIYGKPLCSLAGAGLLVYDIKNNTWFYCFDFHSCLVFDSLRSPGPCCHVSQSDGCWGSAFLGMMHVDCSGACSSTAARLWWIAGWTDILFV